MNIEGRVIQTTRCHKALGEAKEEWKIFRVLSDFFGKEIQFNNLTDLRKMLIKSHKQFEALLELPKNNNKITFGSKKLISDKIINYNIKNFYMNDSISRASETMAKCTKEILGKVA